MDDAQFIDVIYSYIKAGNMKGAYREIAKRDAAQLAKMDEELVEGLAFALFEWYRLGMTRGGKLKDVIPFEGNEQKWMIEARAAIKAVRKR